MSVHWLILGALLIINLLAVFKTSFFRINDYFFRKKIKMTNKKEVVQIGIPDGYAFLGVQDQELIDQSQNIQQLRRRQQRFQGEFPLRVFNPEGR